MSMNKYMHPRNIYKSPPNFKELALNFSDFREFVTQDITGKITLDFKDTKCLRALSCTLLKRDFGLDVEIPLNKLIPTIPLRLNYILWLEDLLSLTKKAENIRGIDIGTGASCVYPLLAAIKNKWTMVATEIDDDNIKYATNNVERNNLQNLIQVVRCDGDTLIKNVVNDDNHYDFCMCNPPFFSSTQELHPFFKSRKSNRPHPKNAFCASVDEVVAKGGEVEFIKKLIEESKDLKQNVVIYTTMVGHKSNLPQLKKYIREAEATSFEVSEFCQGNTTRWGLAWTYHNIDLRKVRDVNNVPKKTHISKPLVHHIPFTDPNECSMNDVCEKVLKLFGNLKMVYEEISKKKSNHTYVVTAFSNTWSHQRRKKREQKRLNSSADIEMNSSGETSALELFEAAKSPKRQLEDGNDYNLLKKLKISTENNNDGEAVFLKFIFSISVKDSNVCLELNCTVESENRDSLNQVLQYIKNNLKK